MILLDTSVLVRYLRTADPKILGVIKNEKCAVSEVTRAEILHGAKTEEDFARLTAVLNQFAVAAQTWDLVGRHLFELRRAGIIIPFPDAIIGTIAISEGLDLWAYDGHFVLMKGVLPELQLFAEPL